MSRNSEIAVMAEDLTVAYDTKPVIWDIDVSFPRAKLTAIIGPNGAGKSTLVKCIMGLIKPISGIVRVHGERGMAGIAYVPQSGSVDWDFPVTVADVVLMGRYRHLGWLKRPTAEDKRIAGEKLAEVGLADFAERQISRLSGGQQQRVFLARALAQEAEVYILDEPLKGVDVKTEKILIGLLKQLSFLGKTVIVVHHDLSTVRTYFDNVVFVNVRLVAQGSVETVFNEQNIALTYGANVRESKDV